MYQKQQRVSTGKAVALLTLISAISIEQGMIAGSDWYFMLCFTAPAMLFYGFAWRRRPYRTINK